MTERMFLVEARGWLAAAVGDEVEVTGAEARHAVSVVRIRAGEPVLLGGEGRRARATVTHTAQDSFTARLEDVADEPVPDPRFVLVQALAKGGRDEQAVETATELGVDEVVPWQAARCVVVWRDSVRRRKGQARWTAVVAAAAKQSRRSRTPVVAPAASTADVVARAGGSCTLVLHEGASDPIGSVPLPASGDVLIVVGPEGGLTESELAALVAAGAHVVRLGPEVLRSSTAGPVVLAVLSARSRWSAH